MPPRFIPTKWGLDPLGVIVKGINIYIYIFIEVA